MVAIIRMAGLMIVASSYRFIGPGHGDAIGAVHLLAFLVIGLVVLAVTNGRLGRTTTR